MRITFYKRIYLAIILLLLVNCNDASESKSSDQPDDIAQDMSIESMTPMMSEADIAKNSLSDMNAPNDISMDTPDDAPSFEWQSCELVENPPGDPLGKRTY